MHDKKSLALIAVAIFSAILIIANGNIEKAYGLTVRFAEPDTTYESVSGSSAYMPSKDYIVTPVVESGFVHLHVVSASSLVQVADIEITDLLTVSTEVRCSATICIVGGQHTLAPSNRPAIARVNMVTLSLSALYEESEYALCTISNLELFGTSVYATLADFGTCPYTGIYSISTAFTADTTDDTNIAGHIQWNEYDNNTVIDTNYSDSCIVSGEYIFYLHSGQTDVRRYSLTSKSVSDSATLTNAGADMYCDGNFSTGYVYVISTVGDWIKKVKMSDLSVSGSSGTITNPNDVLIKGGTAYVTRTDASTVTAFNKADLSVTSFTVFGTLAHNNVFLFKGNATRANAIAPTTNDNIYYAFDGLFDDSEEETETTEEFCIDTNGDGNGDICYTDTNGDGIVDAGGVLEVVTNQNPPAQAVGGILCQLGVVEDCTNGRPTNTDTATNGTGLILFFGLLAILMAVIGSALYGKIKIEYNLIVQVVILMVATGLAVSFDWIEEMWFYIMIFIIVGFASLAGASWITGMRRGQSVNA